MDAELIYNSLEQIRQNQLAQAGMLGEMKSGLDGLCGPNGRVTKLEKAETRQFWLNAAILPLIGVLHSIARKLGY